MKPPKGQKCEYVEEPEDGDFVYCTNRATTGIEAYGWVCAHHAEIVETQHLEADLVYAQNVQTLAQRSLPDTEYNRYPLSDLWTYGLARPTYARWDGALSHK